MEQGLVAIQLRHQQRRKRYGRRGIVRYGCRDRGNGLSHRSRRSACCQPGQNEAACPTQPQKRGSAASRSSLLAFTWMLPSLHQRLLPTAPPILKWVETGGGFERNT